MVSISLEEFGRLEHQRQHQYQVQEENYTTAECGGAGIHGIFTSNLLSSTAL